MEEAVPTGDHGPRRTGTPRLLEGDRKRRRLSDKWCPDSYVYSDLPIVRGAQTEQIQSASLITAEGEPQKLTGSNSVQEPAVPMPSRLSTHHLALPPPGFYASGESNTSSWSLDTVLSVLPQDPSNGNPKPRRSQASPKAKHSSLDDLAAMAQLVGTAPDNIASPSSQRNSTQPRSSSPAVDPHRPSLTGVRELWPPLTGNPIHPPHLQAVTSGPSSVQHLRPPMAPLCRHQSIPPPTLPHISQLGLDIPTAVDEPSTPVPLREA